MDTFLQDLRYAVRGLRRSPGFTSVAVLTLALGIGANAAVFSMLDAALLRTLPVQQPEELVRLQTQRPSSVNRTLSYPLFETLRDGGAEVFEGTFAVAIDPVGLEGADGAELVQAEFVTAEYLDVLGITPALGRPFSAAEVREGARVALLSQELWQRRFAGVRDILGRTVVLNAQPFTVIGVLPAGYTGLVRGTESGLWAPLRSYPAVAGSRGDVAGWFHEPAVSWLNVFARVAEGASAERVREAMAVLDGRIQELGLRGGDEATLVEPARNGLTYTVADLDTPLRLVMAVVVLVLLIASANIAGLLLARGRGRRREMAVRLSLGAARGRLARQLLTESTLLAVMGGVAGLLFAMWLVDLLAAFPLDRGRPLALDLGPDARVLAFTAGVALLTALLFGLAPALGATRPDLVPALKGDASPAAPGRRFGLRDALVIGQVALSLVLLLGAGLLLGSVRNLQSVELGYEPDDVLLVRLDADARNYDRNRMIAFYTEVQRRVAALPGVRNAALASVVSPDPGGSRVEGAEIAGHEEATGVAYEAITVSPGYVETLGLPLLQGRSFERRDVGSLNVLVNATMARRYWPDGAVGGRIILGPDEWLEVVGVVGDTKYRDVREEPVNAVYHPLGQFGRAELTLLARTRGQPGAALPAIRDEVRALDPGVPAFDARTLRAHIGLVFARERVAAILTTAFAALALLLGSIGLYGLLAYAVAQRRREIGVRMAVGASGRDVVRLVLRRGLALALLGVVIGAVLSVGATRALRSLLYGVSALDPLTFVAVSLLVGGVAVAASILPARRASRIDPIIALRNE